MLKQDLDGLGIYKLRAAVPSPVINVLCVQMTKDELKPLVYTEFPGASLNTTTWPAQLDSLGPGYKFNLTGTNVDQMFNWSNDYGHWPPIFPKFPIAYNTVTNQTSQYGREYIYILGQGGNAQGEDYALCGIKGYLTPNCSTHYEVTSSGGKLDAICDDSPETTEFTYAHVFPDRAAHMPPTNATPDFFELVGEWSVSLSLGAGISDGAAANARLLTELILPQYSETNQKVTLQSKLPSIAEALAVMGGSTLLMSIQDSPFSPQWVCIPSILFLLKLIPLTELHHHQYCFSWRLRILSRGSLCSTVRFGPFISLPKGLLPGAPARLPHQHLHSRLFPRSQRSRH